MQQEREPTTAVHDADRVTPFEMLAELREDNLQLAAYLRETHGACEEQGDVASASLIETWIDDAEQPSGTYSRRAARTRDRTEQVISR